MAWNTKEILTSHSKPIPQYFNPVTDQYEALLGANGASRHVLYGPDGNPITTTGDKLAVRATELETQLTAIQNYVDTLEAALGEVKADPAAYTIQDRLKTLATIMGEVSADPTAKTLMARVKNLEDKLAAIIADGVKLSGRTHEQKTFHNALAITDTGSKQSTDVDVSAFKEIHLWAMTSLDQNVTLKLKVEQSFGSSLTNYLQVWDGSAWVNTNVGTGMYITLQRSPSVAVYLNTYTKWSFVTNMKAKMISLEAICNVAPTSGALTTWVTGVKN